jgi:hypothetical protein
MIAIYHSHPDGVTTLSDADLAGAARWNCAHIVIVPELSSDDADYLRAWRLSGNEPTETPVLLFPRPARSRACLAALTDPPKVMIRKEPKNSLNGNSSLVLRLYTM